MVVSKVVEQMERDYIRASALCGQMLATLALPRNKETFAEYLPPEQWERFNREIELWERIFKRDVSYRRFAVLLGNAEETETTNNSKSMPCNHENTRSGGLGKPDICNDCNSEL
jgi:hypothetical protein